MPFAVEPAHDLDGAAGHRGHRRAPIAGRGERGAFLTGGGRHLVRRDVGQRRRAHHAAVNDDHIASVRQDVVPKEGVLGALGVERAEEHDGNHRNRLPRRLCRRYIDNRLSITLGPPAVDRQGRLGACDTIIDDRS